MHTLSTFAFGLLFVVGLSSCITLDPTIPQVGRYENRPSPRMAVLHRYTNPGLQRILIATVSVRVVEVDGKSCKENEIYVSPGRHVLGLKIHQYGGLRMMGDESGEVKVAFNNFKAGRHYKIAPQKSGVTQYITLIDITDPNNSTVAERRGFMEAIIEAHAPRNR